MTKIKQTKHKIRSSKRIDKRDKKTPKYPKYPRKSYPEKNSNTSV